MARDDGCFELEHVHKRYEIRREIMDTVPRRGATRVAVAPLRQGEGADGFGQMRQHALEGAPGVREAVQEQHRDARGVSLLDVGELHLVGKLYGLDRG